MEKCARQEILHQYSLFLVCTNTNTTSRACSQNADNGIKIIVKSNLELWLSLKPLGDRHVRAHQTQGRWTGPCSYGFQTKQPDGASPAQSTVPRGPRPVH